MTHGRTRPQLLGKLNVFFQYVRVSVRANWQSYRSGVFWRVPEIGNCTSPPSHLHRTVTEPCQKRGGGWREASASSPWHLGDPRSRGPAAHSLKPISAENRPWISSALEMRLHRPYVVHRKKNKKRHPLPPFL